MALAIDAAFVLLFVLIGRRTHHSSGVLAGLALTAWPFLAALVAGWGVARAWRNPRELWPTAALIWVVTVALGLTLRGLTGGGLATPFVVVTTATLGLFLIGWRAAVGLLGQRAHSGAKP